jgi:hypothetical protein
MDFMGETWIQTYDQIQDDKTCLQCQTWDETVELVVQACEKTIT